MKTRKVKTFDGCRCVFDFFCYPENGRITYSIEEPFYKVVTSKLYYRHERTWDDHMGNTECGYYVIANLNGHRHRVYID